MKAAEEIGGDEPIFQVRPYEKKKVGIVTTGSEVFKGRIQDTFTPVIREKIAEYGIEEAEHILCDDDHVKITEAIMEMIARGCNMVICTGGAGLFVARARPRLIDKKISIEAAAIILYR